MIYVNNEKLNTIRFPNGEFGIKSPYYNDGSFNIDLKWESDQDLINLMLLRDNFSDNCEVNLSIFYMPYSRMDRKIEGFTFSLKSICMFINNLNFNNVSVYEPHSDITKNLLINCTEIKLAEKVFKYSKLSPDFIMYPDEGAENRYKINGYRSLIGSKERNINTGRIENYEIIGSGCTEYTEFDGYSVVIIDDLCSYGGTFDLASTELKRRGFNDIYLVVAHCEDSILKGNIFKNNIIKKVLTTNSIIDINTNVEGLEIFDINLFREENE